MEGPAVAAAPSPEEERLLIRDITVAAEAHAKEGDTFFLITHRWWQQWLDYVNQDSVGTTNNGSSSYSSQYYEAVCSSIPNRPLAIDNSDLIDDIPSEVSSVEIELHDTLVEGRDYILLPQEVWEKLHGWYGGGPILPRKAIINSGFSQTDLAIEVYPLRLQLILTTKGDRAIVRISKKVSIWDYYGHQKHLLMDDLERTLDAANIQMDQDTVVSFMTMQLQLCSVFFTFSLGTRTHYFGRTILHGSARYRATGRGFVVCHIKFSENYRLYSLSHFVKGSEVVIFLIVFLAYGHNKGGALSYILLASSSLFMAVSWLFAPYIFNPSGFEWQKTMEDFRDWTNWLLYRGRIGVKGEESWEAWWDEELKKRQSPC